MKFILFTFLLTIQIIGYSQGNNEGLRTQRTFKDSSWVEIQLSKNLNETRMGLWETGDYKIYIEIEPLEDGFRNDYLSLVNAMENQFKNDSNLFSISKVSAERYLLALDRLKQAENGFDLRSLIVYIGLYNEVQYKGSTSTMYILVRQAVENGKAKVLYKGERIFTLKKLIYGDSMMSFMKIYYDQVENCAYDDMVHLNW